MTNLIHDGMREKSGGTGGVVGSYDIFSSVKVIRANGSNILTQNKLTRNMLQVLFQIFLIELKLT